MNADMKWLDNPEVFKVNQLEPHSDHCYYLDYSDMKKEKNPWKDLLIFIRKHLMHPDSIKLWFPDILNWLDMIKYVTSTLCIRGKEKSTTEEHIVWRQPEQKKECSQKHSTIR